jgi:hypothetical protein
MACPCTHRITEPVPPMPAQFETNFVWTAMICNGRSATVSAERRRWPNALQAHGRTRPTSSATTPPLLMAEQLAMVVLKVQTIPPMMAIAPPVRAGSTHVRHCARV